MNPDGFEAMERRPETGGKPREMTLDQRGRARRKRELDVCARWFADYAARHEIPVAPLLDYR